MGDFSGMEVGTGHGLVDSRGIREFTPILGCTQEKSLYIKVPQGKVTASHRSNRQVERDTLTHRRSPLGRGDLCVQVGTDKVCYELNGYSVPPAMEVTWQATFSEPFR